LHGLDDQQVDAALDEAAHLLTEALGELLEGDVPERGIVGGGEEAGGADAAGDESGTLGGGELGADAARERRRARVELVGALRRAPFGEAQAGGLEGAGLDHVAPDLEEGAVDGRHQVGSVEHQAVDPPLAAAEVVVGQLEALEARPHGAVDHQHPRAQCTQEGRIGDGGALVHRGSHRGGSILPGVHFRPGAIPRTRHSLESRRAGPGKGGDVARAIVRLAATAAIAVALLGLAGCGAPVAAPHTAATPYVPTTPPVATAASVTLPPFGTHATALPAATAPPLPPPPSVNPAALANNGSASSAGSSGSGRGTHSGSSGSHGASAAGQVAPQIGRASCRERA